MNSSLLGLLLASIFTATVYTAIDYMNRVLKDSGAYPLTSREKQLLRINGFGDEDITSINSAIDALK